MMDRMTREEIISIGMESHYQCHDCYPTEDAAIIWGVAILTEGKLSPGELMSLLAMTELPV